MKKSLTYRLIFGYLGIFLIFIGITCLLPLVLLVFYPEESNVWLNFFIPGISTIAVGIGLMQLLRNLHGAKLGKHQDSVMLVMVWIFAIFICSIPFIARDDMNFSQAMFETTSGFSTIGLTVFKDFDSHLYVFYRAICNLLGGIGLVLIITTAISDKYGLKLYVAEGHSDKPLPNLKKSAAVIFGIYIGIIFVGTVAYVIAGMNPFDAIVHSISAVSTAGFSSKPGGILEVPLRTHGSFLAVQIISVCLMILGATNFLTTFLFLTGKGKKAIKDCELRLFALFAIIFIPLFFISTIARGNVKGFTAFGNSTFTFFSAMTTTGFTNIADVRDLGQATMFLIVFINVVGGGIGSTCGGVKLYRVAVAGKSFYWGTRARLGHSRMVYPHFIYRFGEEKEITHNDSVEAFGYIILYLIIMFIGGFLVTLFTEFPFNDALFEFSNSISSTGLSIGVTTACRDNIPYLWTMIIGMFAGRLEILPIYFAIYRIVRDGLRKETL